MVWRGAPERPRLLLAPAPWRAGGAPAARLPGMGPAPSANMSGTHAAVQDLHLGVEPARRSQHRRMIHGSIAGSVGPCLRLRWAPAYIAYRVIQAGLHCLLLRVLALA